MYKLLPLIALLFSLAAGPASGQRGSVTLTVTAGYGGYYRASPAWVPVHAMVRNTASSTQTGVVVARGGSPAAPAFTRNVILAPGSSKDIVLYIPGNDLEESVTVQFREGSDVVASHTVYPNLLAQTDFTIGAITDQAASAWWLHSVHPRFTQTRVVTLSASALDSVPEALAAFDAIVLTNVDTSVLDSDHRAALEQYVRNGGSLILVGGPSWQSTLVSLPSPLLPGHITSTRTVRNLGGLGVLHAGTPPSHLTAVSVLQSERGAVLAGEGRTPLVVKAGLGDGQIEYLAFDPASAPIAGWRHAAPLLTSLVAGAAPLFIRRTTLMPVDQQASFLQPGPETIDITSELSNFPPLSVPPSRGPLLLSAALALLAMLLLLPAARRRRVLWPAVPVSGLLVVLLVFHLAPARSDRTALVNTLNVVYLQNGSAVHPAVRYVGLYTPAGGNYRLVSPAPALAQPVFPLSYSAPQDEDAAHRYVSGLSFEQGIPSVASFQGTRTWATQPLSVRTDITLRGRVDVHVRPDASGDLVGTVHNGTSARLLEPALVAGNSYQRLPALSPGATASVRVHPDVDVSAHNYPDMLPAIYGRVVPNYAILPRAPLPSFRGPPPGLPREHTLADRIRDAANSLPEAHLLSTIGEVSLIAWSDQHFADPTVPGAVTRHRDLTLFIRPVSITVAPGKFVLSRGVLGAQAIEVDPAPQDYPSGGSTVQPILLGPGGSATFAFDLSVARRARITGLSLDVYAGGVDPGASGYEGPSRDAVAAYDWRDHRWDGLTFRGSQSRFGAPTRYISQTGALLVRITATGKTGELSILDAHQDIQLSGTGTAE